MCRAGEKGGELERTGDDALVYHTLPRTPIPRRFIERLRLILHRSTSKAWQRDRIMQSVQGTLQSVRARGA